MTKKETGVTLGRLIGAAHNEADEHPTMEPLSLQRATAYRVVVNALKLPEKSVTEGYLQAYTGENAGWQSR